jgi:D-arabinose 1-dehydrogenase-like Zn-dependent alcohol dehydrogenase
MGEAVVQVSACGLCGSDLFLQDGGFGDRFPVVAGHEASGVVTELGPGQHAVEVGDLVALNYIHKAGDPGLDASPQENLGADVLRMGVDVPGAMAEYVVRPSATLVRPRRPIGADELAVLTDAVATPFHALTGVAAIEPGETLGVLGLGGIGSNAVQLGHALGAEVTAIGRSDRSLHLAQRLGAKRLIRSSPTAPDEVRTANGGGLDVLVVAVEAPGAIALALAACRPGGRVVIVAASHEPIGVSSVQLIWAEAQLLGSRGYTMADIRAVQDLYLEGSIQVDHLTSDIRPLSDVGRAFRDLRAGGSTRILIHPNER